MWKFEIVIVEFSQTCKTNKYFASSIIAYVDNQYFDIFNDLKMVYNHFIIFDIWSYNEVTNFHIKLNYDIKMH